jgi:plasmid stability protein
VFHKYQLSQEDNPMSSINIRNVPDETSVTYHVLAAQYGISLRDLFIHAVEVLQALHDTSDTSVTIETLRATLLTPGKKVVSRETSVTPTTPVTVLKRSNKIVDFGIVRRANGNKQYIRDGKKEESIEEFLRNYSE